MNTAILLLTKLRVVFILGGFCLFGSHHFLRWFSFSVCAPGPRPGLHPARTHYTPLPPLLCAGFPGFPVCLFFTARPVLRSAGQVFCRKVPQFGLVWRFVVIRLGWQAFGKSTAEVAHPSHPIISYFMSCQAWWLILCVYLPGPWDAQVDGKTLFLGVFVRVFLEGTSTWISELSKADGPHYRGWASSNPLRARIEQKGEEGWTWFLPEMGHPSSAPGHQRSLF